MKTAKLLTSVLISLSCCLLAKERVPGTQVELDVPDGFVKATQFPGFMLMDSGSSIMVTSIPGPFAETTKGFTKEGLAPRGIKLISKEEHKVGGASGFLFHLSQRGRGMEFKKWLLVFGDASKTTLVTATFPVNVEDELSDVLKKSVLSTEWDTEVKVDFFEGLTFRVKESGSLKIANKVGNNLMLSVDGVIPLKNKSDPIVVVGASMSEDLKIPDVKLFSHRRLTKTKGLKNLEVLEEKGVKIDGLDGYFISAKGDGAEGIRYVEQCILVNDDGYYIFVAMAEAGQREKLKNDFRSILYSFKLQKLK